MNYIKHLSGFFDKISKDDRLNPTHISLYVSLFQFWNACRFHNPISISRNEVMKVSKICSKATYHKVIKDLHNYGYLSYKPSYNPFKGSLIYLFNFQTSTEQVVNRNRTKIETSTEQALVPYINNTNNSKQQTEVNLGEQANSTGLKNDMVKKGKEKDSGKKESFPPFKEVAEGRRMSIPKLPDVREYFTSQKFPATEAEKFFNHFESNGWLVGGRSKMKDWQAAARNWMLNSKKFNHGTSEKTNTAGNLHATTEKDYSEPL